MDPKVTQGKGAAVAMAWAGVSALKTHRSYQDFCDNPFLEVLGYLVMSTAPLLLFTGGLAIGISNWNTGPWQGMFLYGVLVLFCMEASSAVLACTSSCQREWETHMLDDLHQYGNQSDSKTKAVDRLQEELQCCGIHNYTDWKVTAHFSAPTSCCQKIFWNGTGALAPSSVTVSGGNCKGVGVGGEEDLYSASGFAKYFEFETFTIAHGGVTIGFISILQKSKLRPMGITLGEHSIL
uniref:Tetraspanin n=1 Tax=Monodelphis domestica TaxID=13616 RepID=A0A5F8HJV1_MONDO